MSDLDQGLMSARSVEKKTVVDETTAMPDPTQTDDNGDEDVAVEKKYEKTDWKKRYSDIRSHTSKLQAKWEEEKKELLTQIAQARPQYKPPKTQEELEEFKSSNPDLYEVVESIAHMKANSELKDVQKSVGDLLKERDRILRETARAELKSYHPDFEQIKESEEFHEWAENQPQEIRDWLFKKNDAKLAARAIALYKAESGNKKKRSAPDSGSADAVSTRSTTNTDGPSGDKIWKQSEIARMTVKEYEKYRKDIDKAFLEGRIDPH